MGASNAPMSESAIQSALKMALAATSIKVNAHCHTLRHCYATHLLEEGVSVRQISAYLGHASLQPTLVYLRLTEVSEAKTQDVLQRLHSEVIHPAITSR
jgi:site-specific recombinase XerD